MPIVQIDMLEGRSLEQKKAMAQKITEVVSETAKCAPEAITVLIRELPKTNIAKSGILMSEK